MVTESPVSPSDPELLRFVRLCLRGRWEPDALDMARRLAAQTPFDWAALLSVADAERLGPLLYRVLRGQYLIPPEVEEALRAMRLGNAMRDRLLRGELVTILDRLAAQSIDVLLLKGAALACMVYGGTGLRPMSDLDLLVREEAVQPAVDILTRLGYRRSGVEVHPGAGLAYENEILLEKPGPVSSVVELHWSLFDLPYYQHILPLPWFWQTGLEVHIGDTRARVLGPEGQILHLCGHVVLHHSHEGDGLLWQHDVAEVLVHYREQIDWDELLRRAQECRLVLPVKQVLGQVTAGWGVAIPAAAQARLDALRPSPEERQAVAWRTAGHRPVAQRFWSDLASMPGWRQRLHYAWIQLFPSAAYMQSRYGIRHRWLLPLYYPYRWWRGLRGIPAALRR